MHSGLQPSSKSSEAVRLRLAIKFVTEKMITLSKKQKLVLLFGMALFVLSALFPPWVYFDSDSSGHRHAGYHFFMNKPGLKSREEMLELYPGAVYDPHSIAGEDFRQHIRVEKDFVTIILQILFLFFFTAGLLIVFKNNFSIGWMIFAIIVFSVSLYFLTLWLPLFRSHILTSHLER